MPGFRGDEKTEDKVDALQNYLYMLMEELRYLLRHLDAENFSDSGLEALAESVFSAAGVAKKVTEEGLSAVMALSGSGPAYFFYLAEAMIDAAVAAGMDRASAEALCKQTMRGAAALWGAEEVPPETLRARVTSKKGTTDAAIRAMEAGGLPAAVAAGMRACMVRGKEMRKEFLGIDD